MEPTGIPQSSGASGEEGRMLPIEELRLVRAYQEGDVEALAVLLRGYQKRIYGICRRVVRDEEAARDLTQDSLIKMMEGLGGFDARAKLSTWVYRITMNCCLSSMRREGIRKHASLHEARSITGATLGDLLAEKRELSGESRVLKRESEAILTQSMGEIDPDHRSVLVLRDMQGLEYQQIGEVLGIPIGTVKSRLFRARAALREVIEMRMGDRVEESDSLDRTRD